MYQSKISSCFAIKGLAAALFLFLAWGPSYSTQNQYCSITSQHTLCKFPGVGAKCKTPYERGIPTVDRNLIMSMHNTFRQLVATGSERKGRPGPQPSASNMRQMEWDEELAATAQRLADQCKYQHDCLDCRKVSRFLTGQNLYQFSENIVRNGADWDTAIRAWYDEVADWSPRHIDEFHFIKPLGHYTQMLWADTYKMGCGYSYFNEGKWNRKLYVCNYGPAGNIITLPMYERGASCSNCPEGTRCSNEYPGLCSSGGGSSFNYATPKFIHVQTTTPRPNFPSFVNYEKQTQRYTQPATTTTTTRPTTTTTRRTTTTTTTTPRPYYTQSTKAAFTYNEIDNNELSHNDNQIGFRRNSYDNSNSYKIQNIQPTTRPTNNNYNYYNSYDGITKSTKRPSFSRFFVSAKPTYTYTTTTTTTTPKPYQYQYYSTQAAAATTTTRKPISFSPRIYSLDDDRNSGLTLFKISSNTNDNKVRPTLNPSTQIQSSEQFADAKVSRLSDPPVESVKDMNSILLFCDFDYAKCPIRFTGESWNYTHDDTAGYGRGFETIVPRHHVTNLYIRSMMTPQDDGNVCLHFRFINYRYGATGGEAKSSLSTVDHKGDPFSLRVTAGTLRQKPKIVEITDLSRHSRDWLTARIQFRNLKSSFLLIFQLPTNFLEDNVYLALDDILVTQGFCHT